MTQSLIIGLFILCLVCAGVICYLLLRLGALRERRSQLEREVEELRTEAAAHDERRETSEAKEAATQHAHAKEDDEAKAPALETSTDAPQQRAGESIEAESTEASATIAERAAPADKEDKKARGVDASGAVDESDVYSLAWSIDDYFQRSSYPKDLLLNERFLKGVRLLEGDAYTPVDLFTYARGPNVVVACMAFEAIARRGDTRHLKDSIVSCLNELYYWPRFYALRAINACAAGPIIAEVLARLNSTWREFVPMQSLREFIAERSANGERMTAAEMMDAVARLHLNDEQVNELANIVAELGAALAPDIGAELRKWQNERVDVEFLKSFGRIREPEAADARHASEDIVMLDAVRERVAEMEAAIRKEPPRSVMLVGDSGTGKTTLVEALARRLQKEHWTILEASAADVLAGQQYIGQLEGRVQTLVRQIGGKRVLWVVPNFHEMLWAGRHQYSPSGVLDLLLPDIESGKIRIIAEVPSAAYEQLLRLRPKLRTSMQTCRVAPLGDRETLELGQRWAERHALNAVAAETDGGTRAHPSNVSPRSRARIGERTLQEAFQLAKQYLGDKAAPGNLLLLLESTHRRLVTENGRAAGEITLDDLLVTLSQLTGLPVQILDEREGLNLRELRAFFEQRVLGQPEAVDCLVERVAMIKAGLTDPTRPQGVFLFVGPTGTGKTEIAKTLAQFLFGSPERMIRLDMSEFQTADSLDRILGETSETSESAALVNVIRKQPFSVVLLDEFEKAHPQVWDLFLQVFDDGRLTDRRGNTADFRHCVVIMTSNLGATLPHGASIGFSQEQAQAQFAAGSVERAVMKTFRREFVNRIDRVVVFRPLGRNVMRDLLRKELNDVLHRRGLRTRSWAVEWDESAIECLLQKGFTADLGARPLKRAIERYLLAPLAMTIVNHQFPEGDQFLFVRSSPDGAALDVQFVDPDAPEPQTAAPVPPAAAANVDELPAEFDGELRLELIAADARGTPEEVRFLRDKFDELAEQVDADDWQQRKEAALQQTQQTRFWDSPARFAVLGLAEYMDRIEAGLDTAGSLLGRLRGSGSRDRTHFPADLVSRIAEQLYLIEAACRGMAAGQPRDAFLLIIALREPGAEAARGDDFARRLAAMYRQWAEKRRMRLKVLDESFGDSQDGAGAGGSGSSAGAYRILLAVSGFAAYSILQPEAGLHVLEIPQDEKSFNRAKVLVHVVAQPDEPAGHGPDALRAQAELALAADHSAASAANAPVVRRYREEPSPLVRDSVRGWRTGKLERVLGGDFDFIF